eukprot:GILI01026202.1.p2 GENE.GILI01026202.1~~GILI01026202.1.p2  ORF type:complete len:168 (-),score=70.37 GILI01026202.1:76-525(-)
MVSARRLLILSLCALLLSLSVVRADEAEAAGEGAGAEEDLSMLELEDEMISAADVEAEFGSIFKSVDEDGDGLIPGADADRLFADLPEEDKEDVAEFLEFSGLKAQPSFSLQDFSAKVVQYARLKLEELAKLELEQQEAALAAERANSF